MKTKSRMKVTVVEVVKSVFGAEPYCPVPYMVTRKNREDIIKEMREYNIHRGGKYPVIIITPMILGEPTNLMKGERIEL